MRIIISIAFADSPKPFFLNIMHSAASSSVGWLFDGRQIGVISATVHTPKLRWRSIQPEELHCLFLTPSLLDDALRIILLTMATQRHINSSPFTAKMQSHREVNLKPIRNFRNTLPLPSCAFISLFTSSGARNAYIPLLSDTSATLVPAGPSNHFWKHITNPLGTLFSKSTVKMALQYAIAARNLTKIECITTPLAPALPYVLSTARSSFN